LTYSVNDIADVIFVGLERDSGLGFFSIGGFGVRGGLRLGGVRFFLRRRGARGGKEGQQDRNAHAGSN
jgi:hypothetical protein